MVYMLKNIFCYSFGLNGSESKYAILIKYGSINSKTILKELIIFAE